MRPPRERGERICVTPYSHLARAQIRDGADRGEHVRALAPQQQPHDARRLDTLDEGHDVAQTAADMAVRVPHGVAQQLG